MNGCGRPAARGYEACCRPCTLSGGVDHGPKCQWYHIHAGLASIPIVVVPDDQKELQFKYARSLHVNLQSLQMAQRAMAAAGVSTEALDEQIAEVQKQLRDAGPLESASKARGMCWLAPRNAKQK